MRLVNKRSSRHTFHIFALRRVEVDNGRGCEGGLDFDWPAGHLQKQIANGFDLLNLTANIFFTLQPARR